MVRFLIKGVDAMRKYIYLPVITLGIVLLWCSFIFSSIVPKEIVIMIDNSGSMIKGDPHFLTKKAVAEFVEHLSEDTRVAVLIFDHRVNLAIPLSTVSETAKEDILASLDNIDFRGKFTNIPAAMEQAIYELKTEGRKESQKSILFITDGIVDTGNKVKDADSARWLREILAEDASDHGIRIYGIAFTKFADLELIQTLAQKTKAEYLRAFTPEDILDAFSLANQYILSREPEKVSTPSLELPQVQALQDTIEEGPIYVTEEPVPTPTSASVEPKKSNLSTIISISLGFLAVVAVTVLFLFRKKPGFAFPSRRPKRPAYDVTEPLPNASLKDLDEVTGESIFNIAKKVTKVGRISAGQEQEDRAGRIAINRKTISRNHAVIEYKNHTFWIIDLGSANGTFLNNKRITTEMRLNNGDVISFDTFDFEFVMEEVAQLDKTVMMDQTVFRPSLP